MMDQERGIEEFPHSFKECRTDMKVVRNCAPLQIIVEHYYYSQLKDDGCCYISRAHIFENIGLVGPHSMILDPSLHQWTINVESGRAWNSLTVL